MTVSAVIVALPTVCFLNSQFKFYTKRSELTRAVVGANPEMEQKTGRIIAQELLKQLTELAKRFAFTEWTEMTVGHLVVQGKSVAPNQVNVGITEGRQALQIGRSD